MKKIIRSHLFLLLVILLAGAFLRFYNLSSNPPSMHADEADTGYSALSIIKTGMDPYGHFLPLQFQGQANIYRAPLYTYSVIPSVVFFGLSPFSVRLPSALFGLVFVLSIYFLSIKLFGKKDTALFAALLAAINPWSIHISRTGLEVNLCLTLITLGITTFLYYGKNKYFIVLSALLFGLSVFAYHAAKIVTPLLIILLFAFYFKPLLERFRVVIVSFFVFVIFYGLMLSLALFGEGAAEYYNVSIFNPEIASKVVNSQRTSTLAPLSISSVFANKPLYYSREFVNKYIGPLSVNYLFVNGESSLDKGIGNFGEFYIFELPFFVIGWVMLFLKKRKIYWFLFGWLLIALIPGGITTTGYYTYRDVAMLPVPILVSGFGIAQSLLFVKQKYKKYFKLGVFAFASISFVFVANFLYLYFFAYPVYSRDWWGYNQKETLEFISQNDKKYDNIYIQGGRDWASLHAFYSSIDPAKFQRSFKNINKGVYKIDNISIGEIVEDKKDFSKKDKLGKNSLLIVPGDFFKESVALRNFYGLDGVHLNLKAYEIK